MKISAIIINTSKKVPRPLNCFMTYRLEMQRKILNQCPGANHRDISKITAKWWKDMTPAEKEPYRRRAEQAKNEHKQLYPDYKFTPKKKVTKTRVYKKRTENEYTSEDFKQKEQLDELYQQRIPPTIELQTNTLNSPQHYQSKQHGDSIQVQQEPHLNDIYSRHGTNTTTTALFRNNKEETTICCADCYSCPNPSSISLKTCFSKLHHYDLPTTMKSATRPSPYAIPSQSTSSSPLSAYSTSPGYYTTLDKFSLNPNFSRNNNNTVHSSSLHYSYRSTIVQEPPSDPFNSPYSVTNHHGRSITDNGLRNYPQHQQINYHHPSFSSSSTSSFEQLHH